MPDEYAGGLGQSGVAALKAFVEAGGTLICLDSSSGLAIESLNLPVTDVVAPLAREEFSCPGSILRITLSPADPLAFGMPAETAAFFANSSAFDMTTPRAGEPAPMVKTVARYAQNDLLMSGWLEGGARIAGRAAVVEARAGKGRAILIGFRAQHRAQSHATFRLLFNAILTSGSSSPAR